MGIVQNSYKVGKKYYIHKRNIASKSNVSGNMYTISFDNDFKGKKFNEDSYVNIQNVLSYAATSVRNPMFSFNNSFEDCKTLSNDSVIGSYSNMNITASKDMFKGITLSDNFNTKEFVNKNNVIHQTLMPTSIEFTTNYIEFNKDHDPDVSINLYDLISISPNAYNFEASPENKAKLLKDIVSFSPKGSHISCISINNNNIKYTHGTSNAIPDKTYAYIIYNNKKSVLEINVVEDTKFTYSYVKMLEQPTYVRILEQPTTNITGSVRIIE